MIWLVGWIRGIVQGNLAVSNAMRSGNRQHDKRRGVEIPSYGGQHNERDDQTA
jgi:hypothetical protein